MDSLVFKKRSRETWTTECERCTGQQHKIKTKRKIFCMKCDRPSDDLKCYLIREGLKFVWQPKLRFHGHVYFEQNLQKISMPDLIYHKNELLKCLKSCKIMCTENSKVTMVMGGRKTFAFTMQVKYGTMTVTFHGDAVVDDYKLLVSINTQSRAECTVNRRRALQPANQHRSRLSKHCQEATISRIRHYLCC